MGKNIRATIIYRKEGQMMQCTKCGEVKVADENNFYKAPTKLGLKSMCIKCVKRYYVENSDKRKTYRANRTRLLKLHNVNTLSQINA